MFSKQGAYYCCATAAGESAVKAACLLATGEHIALVNVLTGFAGAIPTVELMTK